MNLGMSIGLICLTEDASTIVCSLCISPAEFSKLLDFIRHITREHDCTREKEVDYNKKIRSEVIGADFLEECNKYTSSCETNRPKDDLWRMDASMSAMETTTNLTSLKKTQQELGIEINNKNVFKSEKNKINMVETSSKEFYCHHCKSKFLSGKEVVEHICSNISPTCNDEVRIQNQPIHANVHNYKCYICNITFSTITGFKTHKSRIHKDAKTYSCVKCDTNFRLKKELPKHICTNDLSASETKEFYCHLCKSNFLLGKEVVKHICNNISPTCTDTESLQNHPIHINERNYKCDICSITFSTIKGYRSHKSRVHQDAKTFYCVKCDTNFRLEAELQKHICTNDLSASADLMESLVAKNNNQYSCTICSAKLKTSATLKTHMRTHQANRPFKCKYCPHSCINSSTLRRHLQTHEPSSGKTLTCPHCPAILKSRETLRYHLLKHTATKTFSCDYCNGSYYTHSKLKAHLKSSHAALFGKEFRCAFCSAILPSQQSLRYHIMKHKGDKPYKCDQCPLAFDRSCTLKRHVVTHSGKKPYKCEQCPRAFYLKGKLKDHMVVHSGTKPFTCDQCSRGFSHASYLKQHMVSHSGEKGYKCDHCSCSFMRKQSLNKHIKTHTEKEITNEQIA